MKNAFIQVAKLLAAILITIGVIIMFMGAEYTTKYLVDLVGNYNLIATFEVKDSFAKWLIIYCVGMTIATHFANIKVNANKQPKGVSKLLAKWRKDRNITTPNYYVYCGNIIEELLEPIYEKEVIKKTKQEILFKYFDIAILPLDENQVVDTICDIQVFSINELGAMKYNNKKCMLETIKEIDSRIQDPFQKEIWDKNGASGKWQKWEEQPKDTLYVANYKGCRL